MTLEHTTKHMEGYMRIVEAAEGEGNLLGGRMIDGGSLDCAGGWIVLVRRCMRTGHS